MNFKDNYIDQYYKNFFDRLCNSGFNGSGSKYFHKLIERFWTGYQNLTILEVGIGDGEHLKYLSNSTIDNLLEFTSVDIRKKSVNFENRLLELVSAHNSNINIFHYVEGSVENLPLETEYFNRIISTCLFHHINEPLQGFRELRRVLKVGGELAIGLPTDPGFFNRMVKKLITFPKAKKIGIMNPEFLYAMEHQNHISGLIEIAKEVFSKDDLKILYRPFPIKSWNFNLVVVLYVKKVND